MFREARNSLSGSDTMRSSSPKGTPPSGSKRRAGGGHRSRSGSRDVTPEGTLDRRGSINLLDNAELSPLKQFQRMKENGTLKINPRNRRSIDGNQSDPCDVTTGADKENRNFLRMSMTMMDVPSRRSSSICVTGAADLNGAGPSLLKISSEVNIHTSRTSLNPAESSSNVSTITNMSTSSNASSMYKPSQTTSTQNLQKPRAKSEEPKEIVLGHVMGEPIYAPSNVTITPVITNAEHPTSRKSMGMPPTTGSIPLQKPTIEVKLVRNERPRSSYRMSKSVEALDRADDAEPQQNPIYSRFIRHAGSNLRNSFIEKKREPTHDSASEIHNVQNIIKCEKPEGHEEEIYSLPQPQSYSDNTLKAVKTITDKYDTLQMRKLRALSFRESNKSGSSEPNSPTTENGGGPTSPSETRESTPEISEEVFKKSKENISDEPEPPFEFKDIPEKPRSKPPLPPLPPPNLRGPSLRKGPNAKKGAVARKQEVKSHLFVVDPDAVEDSAFMIEPKVVEPEAAEEENVFVEGEPETAVSPSDVVLEPNTEGDEVVCVSSGITQKDISRIDLFFRSRETEVIVSQCLVDMIMGTADPATGNVDMWSSVCHTGVLVLVLNSGLGKRRREMFVVLAERETGFPLWQDRVNYLTNYKDVKPSLHQLQPSNNLRMRVGFRFYCASASAEFISKYRELTVNPQDDLWKVANSRMDKSRRALLKKLRLKKRPSKGDISQPCNFAHVTKLDTKDYVQYESVHDLLPKSPVNSGSAKGATFRPRLQTT